ncbi:MAG: hypothetical protein ACRCTZ_18830 [Sarcina sp.]
MIITLMLLAFNLYISYKVGYIRTKDAFFFVTLFGQGIFDYVTRNDYSSIVNMISFGFMALCIYFIFTKNKWFLEPIYVFRR